MDAILRLDSERSSQGRCSRIAGALNRERLDASSPTKPRQPLLPTKLILKLEELLDK